MALLRALLLGAAFALGVAAPVRAATPAPKDAAAAKNNDDAAKAKKDDAAAKKDGAAKSDDAGKTADETPSAPTANLRVIKLQFRGNRKVEDDAIKINLKTAPGVTLSQEMIRDDVRTIWKMGYFEDVQVEVNEGKAGAVVVFVLREKPGINKIY